MEGKEEKMTKAGSSILRYGVAMENYKPYAAMVFVQLAYAGMALFSKAAVSDGMNPHIFVFYRQAFASLALAPFSVFFERKSSSAISFNLLCQIFMVSLCGLTLSLNLYSVAIFQTSATFAVATTNAIPAITFFLALLLRVESVAIKKVHGLAKLGGSVVGLCGVFVFAFLKGPPIKFPKLHPEIQDYSSTKSTFQGSLLMLSANTAWSLWLVLQGMIVQKYPAKLRLTTLQCLFSCVQAAVWAVSVERRPSAWKLGWNLNLLAVAYCGVIVTGITYWIQVWSIEKKGPVFTAMFTPLALIMTALFSAIFWKEALHWGSFAGAILLVIGLYSVLWGKNKEDGKNQATKEAQDKPKEEIILESITHESENAFQAEPVVEKAFNVFPFVNWLNQKNNKGSGVSTGARNKSVVASIYMHLDIMAFSILDHFQLHESSSMTCSSDSYTYSSHVLHCQLPFVSGLKQNKHRRRLAPAKPN